MGEDREFAGNPLNVLQFQEEDLTCDLCNFAMEMPLNENK